MQGNYWDDETEIEYDIEFEAGSDEIMESRFSCRLVGVVESIESMTWVDENYNTQNVDFEGEWYLAHKDDIIKELERQLDEWGDD